ncbi:MAG: hypothetical protein KUG63_03105 [Cycloclasticus sp.]|jgi:hypothetical protein|uniref:hypothetical protein n=1 Tax=Cycloclasticus sp. TaxID=2024830 RepID=UPI00257FF73C|nr:hypothetical protein [Cycloclasticus sp.]MBV1898344.1 hypothetical protein [Cycloclasticus sp.]
MPEWMLRLLVVFASSPRVLLAFILGPAFYVVLLFIGEYSISNFELQGQYKVLEDTLTHKMMGKYDKAGLLIWLTSWVSCYKFYKKDKNKFY